MTPAVIALTKATVPFSLHEYIHDPSVNDFGNEAVDKLNISANRVFKTLIVSTDSSNNIQQLAVAIVPVSQYLNLKAMAKSLDTKKVQMADPFAAQKATGYLLGGISPFGQKKRLPFRIDKSAEKFDTIFVSGGKRGLEIEVAPEDLITFCNAIAVNIITK